LHLTSEAERRQNPTAVMDALQVFDKKLREPLGQKYMGARSVEDLSAEPETTPTTKEQDKNELVADSNGMPILPPKNKDAENKQKPVSAKAI